MNPTVIQALRVKRMTDRLLARARKRLLQTMETPTASENAHATA